MAVLNLLDTNILVHQVRCDAVGERIRKLYSPLLAEPRPLISVVTEGELRSLGFQLGWCPRRRTFGRQARPLTHGLNPEARLRNLPTRANTASS